LGSHNIRSIAHGLALAHHLNLPPGRAEIQMLYGMADPIKAALVSLGQRVRVYTPYGQLIPGMAYLVRRLLENTSDDSFLRAGFVEHVSEEKLLMNPLVKSAAHRNGPRNDEPVTEDRSPRGLDGVRNEPVSDFSREESRRAIRQALEDIKPYF